MREREEYDDTLDQQPPQTWTEEDRKIFSWTLAGTGALALGADVIAHWGVAGLLFGLPAAFLLSKNAPHMYAEVKEFLPWSEVQDVVEQTLHQHAPGGRSLMDRAMGRNYADQQQDDAPEKSEQNKEMAQGKAAEDAFEDDVDSPMQALISRLAQNMRHSYARVRNPKRALYLSENFHPDVDEVGGLGILVAAMKGAGKTVLGVLLAEQFARFYIPMAIFDKEGDILSALSEFPNGRIVGHERKAGSYPAGQFIGITADEAMAYQVGYAILEHGYQAIFDLRSFKNDEERAHVMIGVIDGMMAWADERENAEDRVPALIFLDEAAHWMPEDEKLSKLSSATLGRLIGAFTETAQMGRKRGLIRVYLCQRISELKKSVMAESDLYIFGRARLDNDLKRYMEYVDPATLGIDEDTTKYPVKAAKKMLASLGRGDFVVCMPDRTQFVSHFNERKSKHVSHMPKAEKAMERYAPERQEARARAPEVRPSPVMPPVAVVPSQAPQEDELTYEELLELVNQRPDVEPEDKRYSGNLPPGVIPSPYYEQTAGLSPSLRRRDQLPTQQTVTPPRYAKYQKALEAWHAGNQTMRELAAALGIPDSAAYRLMQEMDTFGLIQMKKRKQR